MEEGKYMIRRRFRIPESEYIKYYGKQGDLDPNDFLFPCDYEEESD